MVGGFQIKRLLRALGLLFVVALYISFSFQNAFAASGITYTGRIFKGDQPLDSGVVRFDVWVKTKDNCVLYYERRNIDMTGSSGTYAFEIGDANIIPGSQSFPQSGIQTIGDIFNNAKSRANGDVDTSLPCSTFNPTSDEGRLMTVSFTPQGETAQALPDLAITAVPTAFQAFNANKVNGYGTGDLLKVDPTVVKTTYANGALTQAQYDEFWKLILGTSTTYLKAIPTLGGDISGTLPAVTVTKIQNVAVTAPTTGDTGKVLTYNGTGMVWSAAAAGGITTLNGLSGTTQSFISGTTPLTITSSGSAHTFDITNASSSASGLLTQTDWNTFNSKQSSALGSGQVWIGNASNGAQAQTLSGDATVSASGNVTVDKTQSAQASKILQLDSSGNAYVAGVDIKGSSATAKLRFTGSTDMTMNLPTTSGTANQFLQTDGAGNLSWASQSAMLPTISAGQVWVGNASNGAQAFTLSGDIASVSNTGVVTLSSSATGSNKLPLAGGTMSGAINMGGNNISNAGDVSLAAGKFLGLGVGSTAGTVTGQMWYDSGVIKYFDGTTTQSLGVAGAGITSLNGLTSNTQSFVVGSAGNAPAITSAGSAHTLDIPMASASGSVTAGLISNADYASMMAKQSNSLAAGQVWVGNASGAAQAFTLSGDVASVSNTGSVTVNKTTTGQANYILALDGSGVANVKGLDVQTGTGKVTLQTAGAFTNYVLTLPSAAPAANQIMKSDASGNLSWVTYLANVSDAAPLTNGKMWIGNASGIASEVTMSGDATITNAGLLSLKNTGTAGTYTKVITDAQGRVTSGSALASGDVTAALGYTPADAAAAGYVNGGNTFSGNATIGLNDNYNLGFKTNNNTYMTLTADGKLGIDTTNPISKLQIGNTNVTTDYGTTFMISGSGCPSCAGSARIVLEDKNAPATTVAALTYGANNFAVGSLNSAGSVWNNSAILNINTATDVSTFSGVLNTQNVNIASGKFLGLGAGSTAGTVAGQMWYDSGVIKYFDGTTTQSLGVAGAGITSLNGLTSNTQSFVVGSAGNAPAITSASSAHTLDIPMASASGSVTAGLISNADYSSMMAKQSSALPSTQVWVGNASGAAAAVSLSGDIASITNAGLVTVDKTTTGVANKIVALDGSGVANVKGLDVQTGTGKVTLQTSGAFTNYVLTLPNAQGGANTILQNNGTGVLSWVSNAANVNNAASLTDGKMWLGNSGNVAVEVAMSGDATITNAGLLTLKSVGTAGTYFKVVTDGQGRVTSGSALASGDVTAALGYTPADAAVAGYVNGGNTFAGNATIGLNDAYNLGIKTNGTTRMTVSGAGNVGIGTASPTNKLHVDGGTTSAENRVALFESTVTGAYNGNAIVLNQKQSGSAKNAIIFQGNGTDRWAITNDVVAANAQTFTIYDLVAADSRLTINSSGYTGLGTSWNDSFANQLTVKGNASIGSGYIGNAAPANGLLVQGKVGIATTNPAVMLDVGSATDAIRLPNGTDAQRPTNAKGNIRYNTTSDIVEYNNGSAWVTVGSALGYTPVNKAGDTMSGSLMLAAGQYLGLGSGSTAGTVAGQMWYDSGVIKYFDGTTVKSLGVAGSGITSLNGLTANVQSFVVGSAGNAPAITSASSAHTLDIPMASASGSVTAGLISNADYASMMAKQSNTLAAGQMWVGNASGVAQAFALSGDVSSVSNTGSVVVNKTTTGASNTILSLDGTGVANAYGVGVKGATSGTVTLQAAATTANYSLKLPATTPAANQVMQSDASGNLSWATALSSSTAYVNGGNTFAGNATIGLNDNYNLGFKTNNTTKMTLTSDGKLGIGTTTPNTALAIASGDITLDAGYSMMWGQSAYSFINGDSGPSSHLILGTSGAIVMTLDVNGNVGIGTNPAFTLDMGSRTDAIRLPQGTAGQQPANTKGLIRFNTTSNTVEYNNGSAWVTVAASLGYTPVNKAGDTMSGDLSTQNINIAAGKYLGLGAGSTAGTVAGQMWYDSGVIKYFDGTSTKSLGIAGSGITSLNGLTANVQSFAIGTSGNSPAFASATSTHTLNIPMASAASVTAGLLSNADYTSMMAKQSNTLAAGQMWVGNASGVAQAFALSGDVSSVSNSGSVVVNKTTTGASSTILSLDGSGVANVYGVGVKGATSGAVTLQAATTTANYSLKLPATTPTANQVMQSDASGNLSWVTALTSATGFINGGNTFAGNATIGLNDAYTLGFKTNNTTQMTLTAAGRLGIGTATPSGTLEVQGGTAAASVTGVPITLKAQNGGSGGAVGGSIYLTPGDGTSGWPGGTVVIATTGGQNGAISINNDKTSSYTSSASSTAPSYVMRLANSYNQNGNTALIDGTVKNSSALYQEGYMGFVSVSGAANYSPDFVLGLQNGSNSYQERIRVNGSTGNVGIGTSSPAATLDVVGSAAFENNTASTAAANFSFWKSRNYAAVQLNDNLGFFSYYGSDGSSQQRSAYISSTVDDTVATNSVPANLVFATTQAGGTDSTERMRITSGGNVGINTVPSGNAKLEVSGAIVSVGRSVASGATVNLAQGNTTVLASVGGSAITLQNMVNGGNYTLVITDTTSRTYTFTGCNSSKFSPANQATIGGTPSVYNILTIYNGSSYDCYITWSTGFQ